MNVVALQNYFVLSIGTRNCAVNMRSVDVDRSEVSFSSTVNLFYTGWKRFEYLNRPALAASYCKLENHLVFYFNLLLKAYLLYSIKATVSHRSLVCFRLVINFIITVLPSFKP